MNKAFDSLLVFVGLCLIAASWSMMTETNANAAVHNGYTCLNIVGDKSCSQAGNTVCRYAEGGNPQNCKGTCTFCQIDTVIGNAVCAKTYAGETCTTTTGSFNCGAGVVKNGGCARPQGVCDCLFPVGQNACADGFWTYPRCAPAKN